MSQCKATLVTEVTSANLASFWGLVYPYLAMPLPMMT